MLRPNSGDRVDCPDTGRAVMLAGADVECTDPDAYYTAAKDLNIFFSNVVEARGDLLEEGKTELFGCSDRLTPAGRELVANNPPPGYAEIAILMGRLTTEELA